LKLGWYSKNIPIIKEDTPDATKVPNNVDAMPAIVEDLTFAMNNLPDVAKQLNRDAQPNMLRWQFLQGLKCKR